MAAVPGRFVIIKTGEVFDGYEENGQVGETLTKAGHLPRNSHLYFLDWGDWGSPTVARYDEATEDKANALRDLIWGFEEEIRTVEAQCLSLYQERAKEA